MFARLRSVAFGRANLFRTLIGISLNGSQPKWLLYKDFAQCSTDTVIDVKRVNQSTWFSCGLLYLFPRATILHYRIIHHGIFHKISLVTLFTNSRQRIIIIIIIPDLLRKGDTARNRLLFTFSRLIHHLKLRIAL